MGYSPEERFVLFKTVEAMILKLLCPFSFDAIAAIKCIADCRDTDRRCSPDGSAWLNYFGRYYQSSGSTGGFFLFFYSNLNSYDTMLFWGWDAGTLLV